MNGTLKKCYVGHDAWLTCSSHALSTEKQEVMGLLLGRWLLDRRGVGTVAIVESAMVLARTDRRKDRVEVGYEQLAAASEMAEQQGRRSGREVLSYITYCLEYANHEQTTHHTCHNSIAQHSSCFFKILLQCRVIGWYHSHPHITVEPSHVDVRTQGQYQAMDPAFLGLIFSCFSTV